MAEAKPFEFFTEFTPSGEVLTGKKPAFKRVEDVEQEVLQAREATQTAVMGSVEARIATALETIAANLTPSEQVVANIATTLRNEAIDLAMTASEVIAGKALDENGHAAAEEAVAEACKQLRSEPRLIVTVSPEAELQIKMRLENMPAIAERLHFVADPAAQPGDWRIEFQGGAAEFNRDVIKQTVEDCLNNRKADPIEDQLDLFGTA
ncbi:FliH/SctL family protein [Hirschia maritima]|uniref:FliH/SctL family protein n=1 Tax=Hirschia maritima TaxID=1121961 RepID=UPI0003818BF1|nr:FliH/SctL family protein [Hirschia maritima]